MIAKSKKSSPVQRAAAVLIFAVLAGVGLTDAYPAPPPLEFGTPTNLGPTVNTSYTDCAPSISSDGLTLYFSDAPSNSHPGGYGGGDIWVATRSGPSEAWDSLVNLGPPVNTSYGDAAPSISSDGLSLFFSSGRPGGHGGLDLWVSRRPSLDDDWGTPENLGPTVNSDQFDSFPCISQDGLSLYFYSERPGGFGRGDLWVTRRTGLSQAWGPPGNLGPNVNSPADDGWPCLFANGLALMFNSNRAGGYGSYDLYMSTRPTTEEQWGQSFNLGAAVNSSSNDGAPSISSDGRSLFFHSERPGGEGDLDLWQAPILAAPTCGDAEHPYPAVDLNKDCRVDLADLAVLLAHWLECTAPECE